MSEGAGSVAARDSSRRLCARVGCNAPVKKATGKYCSVRCCSIDPQRLQRLRNQARRVHARPLVMSRQLSLTLPTAVYDSEAELEDLCRGREDAPQGMSRLAG